MRSAIVALLLLAGGCPPSLDEFVVVPSDGAIPLRDGTVRDGASDGSPSDAAVDSSVPTGGPCAEPVLMIGVESIDGAAPPYGRVARFSLLPDDEVRRCGDLTAGGEMMQLPQVVAAPRSDRVIVADLAGVYIVIDPRSDTVVTRGRIDGRRARDAFSLRDPGDGREYAAVAWSSTSSDDIRWISLYGDTMEPHLDVNITGSTGLVLGLNVASVTRSPVDPSRMLALRPDQYAAVEADPFALAVDTSMHYADVPDGALLDTIAAVQLDGGYERVIWTGENAGEQGVFYMNDRGGRSPSGPYTCDDRVCEIFHAVPDPRHPQDWLALCGGAVERDVVQFNQFTGGGRTCRVILAASEFESRTRYSYLSTIGLP
jgi:hypothetical protein